MVALRLPAIKDEDDIILTKRYILKRIAGIFDPLGILAPLTMPGKWLIQKLWRNKILWDEEIAQESKEEWLRLKENWELADCISIPRFLGIDLNYSRNVLVTFVDASKIAYAAVVYLVMRKEGKINSQIIFSKNRLAPIKEMTIPRLELMAALIGKRATTFVEKELGIRIDSKYIFSDSKCVLYWLKSTKPLGVFIGNRVKELKSDTTINYRYVRTDENPADIATRFIEAKGFQTSIWFHGPEWLIKPIDEWPLIEVGSNDEIDINNGLGYEADQVFHNLINAEIQYKFDITRFSSFQKSKRVLVYVFRFIKIKIRELITRIDNRCLTIKTQGTLTLEELRLAELILIQQCQDRHFNKDSENQNIILFKQLGVEKDQEGIYRCHGRFDNARMEEESKYPILLPSKDYLTSNACANYPLNLKDLNILLEQLKLY